MCTDVSSPSSSLDLILPELILLIFLPHDPPPHTLPEPLLLRHSKHQHQWKMPHTSPEQRPRRLGRLRRLTATGSPEPPRLPHHPGIDHRTRDQEPVIRHPYGREPGADGEHQHRITKRDAGIQTWTEGDGHLVPCVEVFVPDGVGEGVEVRELPREEQCGQEPATCSLGRQQQCCGFRAEVLECRGGKGRGGGEIVPPCCGPAHQRRDGAYDGAGPGVEDGEAFEGRVDEGVEDDVGGSEGGGGGVHAVPEDRGAGDRGGDGEEDGAARADQAPDQWAVARAGHLGVVGGFEEHVQCVGGGDGGEGAGCEEEEGEG